MYTFVNKYITHYFLFYIINIIVLQNLQAQTQAPRASSGRIVHLEQFPSQWIIPRNIDIWLPEGYHDSIRYAVLYMHDGQMLFDSTITWNRQSWQIDETVSGWLKTPLIKKCIVVGIWSNGKSRHADYFPQKPFEKLTDVEKDSINQQLTQSGRTMHSFVPNADNYLKFIVEELKPYIDRHYSVRRDYKNTFIAGSSMGGLISWYALCEYPNVFGGAACLSTHWPGTFTLKNNPIPTVLLEYINTHLPPSGDHLLYFDCGDQTLDALYPEIQRRVDKIMIEKGYDSDNWMTRYFPGEDHSERAWSSRFFLPLIFLLKS
jgi:predicted alpha/beta superfamily hydrolase